MPILDLIKRLPVDLGQGHYRHKTKAKLMAFKLVGRGSGREALDLGCGDGYWSRQLKQVGWRVTSADNFDFRHGSAIQVNAEKKLPFPDNKFDLVWASEVIEHIHNIDDLILEFRRITRPGGRVILTTPNSAFWLYYFIKLFGIAPKDIQNPDHKQFFSMADITRLFPSASIFGFFPYALLKYPIRSAVGMLSPTFIIVEIVNKH